MSPEGGREIESSRPLNNTERVPEGGSSMEAEHNGQTASFESDSSEPHPRGEESQTAQKVETRTSDSEPKAEQISYAARYERYRGISSFEELAALCETKEPLSPVYKNQTILSGIHGLTADRDVIEPSLVEAFFAEDRLLAEKILLLNEASYARGRRISPERKIACALTFETFKEALEEIGTIEYAGEKMTSEVIMERIDSVLRGNDEAQDTEGGFIGLAGLPTEFGIRERANKITKMELNEAFVRSSSPVHHEDVPELKTSVGDEHAETPEHPSEMQGEEEPSPSAEEESIPAASNEVAQEKVTPETQENEINPEEKIYDAFKEKFGITKEQLEHFDVQMEGEGGNIETFHFKEFSSGQKELVLQNLADLTLGRIVANARGSYENDIVVERANASIVGSKLLGNIWVSFRESFVKNQKVRRIERKLANDVRSSGLAVHGETLGQLMVHMRRNGPEAEHTREGELIVHYARELEGMNEREKEKLAILNAVAFEESNKTYEDHLVRSRRELANEKREPSAYESMKAELMREMKEVGKTDSEIMRYMADVDQRVMMNQFIRTNKDAVRALGDIDDKSFLKTVMQELATERSAYAVGGYVARTAVAGMFGLLAAPLASAGIGGIRSWKKAEAEICVRDREARKGKRDTSGTALNMISAEGERGTTAKLHMLMERVKQIDALIESKEVEGKLVWFTKEEIPDAAEREKANNEAQAQHEAERSRLLVSLSERIRYTEDKLRLGQVDFGSKNELDTKYRLLNELSQAKIRAMELGADQNERTYNIRERLEKMLTKTEKRIDRARLKKKAADAAEGALIAGGFSFVAAYIADLEGDRSGARELDEHLKKLLGAEGGDAPTTLGGALSAGEVPADEIPPITAPVSETPLGELPTINEYEVKPGDTFSAILRENVSGITDLPGGGEQNQAVMSFINELPPETLKELGVSSGNPNLIKVGETIDLDKLRTLYEFHSGGLGAPETMPTGVAGFDTSIATDTEVVPSRTLPEAAEAASTAKSEVFIARDEVRKSFEPLVKNETFEKLMEDGVNEDTTFKYIDSLIVEKDFEGNRDLWNKYATDAARSFVEGAPTTAEGVLLQTRLLHLGKLAGVEPSPYENVHDYVERAFDRFIERSGSLPRPHENIAQFLERAVDSFISKHPELFAQKKG